MERALKVLFSRVTQHNVLHKVHTTCRHCRLVPCTWPRMRAGVFDGADTQRFYITVANYALAGGQHLSSSQLLVAVSATANPAEGFVGPFRVPTMGLDEGGQVRPALLLEHFSTLANPTHSSPHPKTTPPHQQTSP